MQIKKIKTVNGIMAAFTKTITDLETVAEQNQNKVETLEEQKAQIDSQISVASDEISRANKIAASLKGIVGTD